MAAVPVPSVSSQKRNDDNSLSSLLLVEIFPRENVSVPEETLLVQRVLTVQW